MGKEKGRTGLESCHVAACHRWQERRYRAMRQQTQATRDQSSKQEEALGKAVIFHINYLSRGPELSVHRVTLFSPRFQSPTLSAAVPPPPASPLSQKHRPELLNPSCQLLSSPSTTASVQRHLLLQCRPPLGYGKGTIVESFV